MEIIDRDKKIIFIVLVLITVFILCISVGTVYIPFLEIWKVILKKLFNLDVAFQGLNYEEIIYYVRLPRVLVGCLVGGGLALSGAVMQSVFKNPMADAGILGISSGASLGAVITIALGLTAKSMIYMPVMAIFCSFVLGMIVYKLSSYRGRTSTLTLILSGVAISTLVGAIISLIITNVSEHQMKEYVFWSMGSLVGRRWEHVHLIAIPIILISLYIMRYSRELNILLLGDEESHSLGINPNKFRKKILFLASVIVALGVCVSGYIGFVGLIIPHITRMIVGANNKIVLPVSFLSGGIFLMVCDLFARTLFSPTEISVGIITSILGAPYFIYLLLKSRKEEF